MWSYNNSAYSNELQHHGILGMKWGVRRYQNADGTLTNAGRRRLAREEKRMDKKDLKWADKNYNKIYKKAYKSSQSEMNDYIKNELSNSGKVGKYLINDYNKKLAELMNKNISEISSPSGKVVQFVAKRGEVGVHMGLVTKGYDMSQLKNGVYSSGKVAYRKKNVDMV